MARGSLGSFYKHSLKKEKSAYSSIIRQHIKSTGSEGMGKVGAAGCFRFEVKWIFYSDTLTNC